MLEYLIGFISEYFGIIILIFLILSYLSIFLRSFRKFFIISIIMAGLYLVFAWLWRNGIGYEPLYLFTMNIIYSAMQMFEKIFDFVKASQNSFSIVYMLDFSIIYYILSCIFEIGVNINLYDLNLELYFMSLFYLEEKINLVTIDISGNCKLKNIIKLNSFESTFFLRC